MVKHTCILVPFVSGREQIPLRHVEQHVILKSSNLSVCLPNLSTMEQFFDQISDRSERKEQGITFSFCNNQERFCLNIQ